MNKQEGQRTSRTFYWDSHPTRYREEDQLPLHHCQGQCGRLQDRQRCQSWTCPSDRLRYPLRQLRVRFPPSLPSTNTLETSPNSVTQSIWTGWSSTPDSMRSAHGVAQGLNGRWRFTVISRWIVGSRWLGSWDTSSSSMVAQERSVVCWLG